PTNRTLAADARDGSTYWVRLIPGTNGLGDNSSGDLCWMETNLAYAGGGDDTYNDTISGMTLGSTANDNIASGQACYGSNATMAANPTTLCYWIPLNANPTSGRTSPSTATDGGAGIDNTTTDTRPTSTRAQFGYLYNWCTAMAGQSVACQITAATQPNQSVNPGNGTTYNICPAGWRLPTGEATTGEFALLISALDWTSGAPTPLFTNGLYMFAGTFGNGSFSGQGSLGGYWSSTISIPVNGFRLALTSTLVGSSTMANKGYGYSVRCVAP
ncbi:fibrobacter succinogenes major paralogous domain-containing protein, partial [Candidatus Saccharibacteria bacterium]|nr:fibrobacter succinogenes major paralogous domain-containing protein [Candidatus Saccharibacteria bacterium]